MPNSPWLCGLLLAAGPQAALWCWLQRRAYAPLYLGVAALGYVLLLRLAMELAPCLDSRDRVAQACLSLAVSLDFACLVGSCWSAATRPLPFTQAEGAEIGFSPE